MAMTPEAKVKKKVKETLHSMGAYFLQPIGTGFGSMGAPDIVVCYKKFFIGIECKAGRGKLTAGLITQAMAGITPPAGVWPWRVPAHRGGRNTWASA